MEKREEKKITFTTDMESPPSTVFQKLTTTALQTEWLGYQKSAK